MIEVVIEYTGTFVDRPVKAKVLIAEDTIAAEEMLASGKTRKITARQLYDIYKGKGSYVPSIETHLEAEQSIYPENDIIPQYFEEWVRLKFLKSKNYYEKIISIAYHIT